MIAILKKVKRHRERGDKIKEFFDENFFIVFYGAEVKIELLWMTDY